MSDLIIGKCTPLTSTNAGGVTTVNTKKLLGQAKVKEDIKKLSETVNPAPKQDTPRSASVQASGHEVPTGSLAESAQEMPRCTCGSTHGDTHEDNCPMFPKRETPIRELAKQEAQQGTYFAIPVQETPASNYLDSEWGGDNDLPQTPAPAAFSDAERNAFRFGYEQRGRDRNNHTYNPNRTDADIDVAMLAAGLTPAATPERQDAMTALRSIEAMLGTLDHSEAVEEDCLVKHVTAKVAELVNRERELPTDAIDVLALALFGEDYFREHRDSCRAEFLLDAGGAAQIIGRLRASSGGYNGGDALPLGMTSGSRPPAMNAYNMRNIAKRMEQFQVSPSDIRHMLQWADYIEEWAALKGGSHA